MADEGFNVSIRRKATSSLPPSEREVSDREESAGTVIAAMTCMQCVRTTSVFLEVKISKGKVILGVSNTCFKPEAATEVFALKTSSADNAKTCCNAAFRNREDSFFHSSRLGFYAVCGKREKGP